VYRREGQKACRAAKFEQSPALLITASDHAHSDDEMRKLVPPNQVAQIVVLAQYRCAQHVSGLTRSSSQSDDFRLALLR
jgi:hypothetical protein